MYPLDKCPLAPSVCGLSREGEEFAKDGRPLFLAEVVDDIVHEMCSCRAPGISIELLTRGNEISSSVHLVCTFNLTQDKSSALRYQERQDMTYCSGDEGEDTQRSASNSGVSIREGLHNAG